MRAPHSKPEAKGPAQLFHNSRPTPSAIRRNLVAYWVRTQIFELCRLNLLAPNHKAPWRLRRPGS